MMLSQNRELRIPGQSIVPCVMRRSGVTPLMGRADRPSFITTDVIPALRVPLGQRFGRECTLEAD